MTRKVGTRLPNEVGDGGSIIERKCHPQLKHWVLSDDAALEGRILISEKELKGRSKSMEASAARLVVTVHGIRTYGQWQERLESLVASASPEEDIDFLNYKYGYFSVIAFIIPLFRWLVVRRFRRELVGLTAKQYARIDLVGHSFGTHVIAWSLTSKQAARIPAIHTIILAGSVLRSGFPWRDLIGSRVKRVVNDCGSRDSILLLSQFLILFTGMAGRTGFSGATGATYRNRYSEFGHSGYFQDAHGRPSDAYMHTHWVPLLTGVPKPVASFDERKPRWFDGLVTFLGNNAEPIKILVYVTPFILITSWIYALYVRAETERREADLAREAERSLRLTADSLKASAEKARDAAERSLRNAQVQESRRLANLARQSTDHLDFGTAIGLSLAALPGPEKVRPYLAEAENELYRAVTQLRERAVFEHADSNIRSVNVTADGRRLFVSGGDAALVDIANGRRLKVFFSDDPNVSYSTLLDENRAFVIHRNGDASILDIEQGTVATRIQGQQIFTRLQPRYCASIKKLLTAELDKIRLWDDSGKPVYQTATNSTGFADFSSDCRLLYVTFTNSASQSFLQVLETETLRTVALHSINGLRHVFAVQPGGDTIAGAASSNDLYLSDGLRNVLGRRLSGHGEWIRSVSFSADGRKLASGADDGLALIWDAATGSRLVTLQGHQEPITSIVFSKDGKFVATASQDKTARVWNASSGKLLRTFRGHSNEVSSVFFAGNGYLVSISRDTTSRVWATGLDAEESAACTRGRAVRAAAISGDGSKAILSDSHIFVDPKTIQILDAVQHKASALTIEGAPSTQALAFSPDNRKLAAALVDNTIRIFDLIDGKEMVRFTLDAKGVFALAFIDGGKRLVTASRDGFTRVWSVEAGTLIIEIKTDGTSYGSHSISRDGTLLTSGGAARKVAQLWDLRTGTRLQSFSDARDAQVADMTADGKLVATGGINMILWDAESGNLIERLRTPSLVSILKFAPDGERLLSAGSNRPPRLWKVKDRSYVDLDGNGAEVVAAAFGLKGTRLGIAFSDGTIRLWNSSTGEQVGMIAVQGEKPLSVAFADEDKRVVASFSDGCLRSWPVFPSVDSLVAYAEKILPRSLSEEQRKEFFLADD